MGPLLRNVSPKVLCLVEDIAEDKFQKTKVSISNKNISASCCRYAELGCSLINYLINCVREASLSPSPGKTFLFNFQLKFTGALQETPEMLAFMSTNKKQTISE